MKSEGVCSYCKGTFSGRAMARLLKSCKKKPQNREGNGKVFLIKASAGPFFVYFEVNAHSTLKEIDSFLRGLWLECCGHLSAFTIGKTSYSSSHELDYGEKSMDIKLKDILRPNLDFYHEYDLGTTTLLNMKCILERSGKVEGINIVARNNLPDFKCDKCGKPAKEICTQCARGGERLLCASCAEKHECDEEMFLPVVNSPRTGVCGYTGGD